MFGQGRKEKNNGGGNYDDGRKGEMGKVGRGRKQKNMYMRVGRRKMRLCEDEMKLDRVKERKKKYKKNEGEKIYIQDCKR